MNRCDFFMQTERFAGPFITGLSGRNDTFPFVCDTHGCWGVLGVLSILSASLVRRRPRAFNPAA
jgi:hypothetical protein